MARPAKYDDTIGEQVDRARKDGVPWKVICDELGLKKTRLWMHWKAWLAKRPDQKKCS